MAQSQSTKPAKQALRSAWRSNWRLLLGLGLFSLVLATVVVAGDLANRPSDAAAARAAAQPVASEPSGAVRDAAPAAAGGSPPAAGNAVAHLAAGHLTSTPIDASAFTGDRAETERFVAYERDIQLTPEQERVRLAALTPLPAPCCKNFSAATCCCRCNMAKATWGLAKHLIVHERASAERVRSTVAAWHSAINPDGFTGDACFTGGCSRAFAKNGCGGMEEGQLVF